MNILIHMGHPAHYHLFKNVISNLQADGHIVYILIKKKDILEDLLKISGLSYVNILPNERSSSLFGIAWGMILRLWRIFWFTIHNKVNLLMGSSTEVAQVAWILRRRSIIFAEDDASVVPQFVALAAPFVDSYLSPISCNNGKIEKNSIKYAGFHKLAYLHPNQFSPNKDVVIKSLSSLRPYFLLRFAKLKAYHDLNVGATGINTSVAQHLIDILVPYGDVYISSERELEPQFEKYRLKINPLDIHHIMAYATMYIGDSQSMAVEAAMLGTPSLRFNNFAGKIGVLEELEQKYKLTFGIPSSEPDRLYAKIKELLSLPNLKEEFQSRRQIMLEDKIDVTAFFTWFIENYPESKRVMKENPEYQYKFK